MKFQIKYTNQYWIGQIMIVRMVWYHFFYMLTYIAKNIKVLHVNSLLWANISSIKWHKVFRVFSWVIHLSLPSEIFNLIMQGLYHSPVITHPSSEAIQSEFGP